MTKQDADRLDKLIKRAGGIVGRKQETFMTLYETRLKDKLNNVLTDDTHPLQDELDSRRIERSGRLRAPAAATQRYKKSLIPRAISKFNDDFTR